MNVRIVRAVRQSPPGDRAPYLAILARRSLGVLAEVGPHPRPAEPAAAEHQRRRHRRELAQLQALARVYGLKIPGVEDA